ncbi:proteasome subunit beta [Pseudonocardia asaccharolytica]|uniref:Proteasome subunit beta n=1 Tax=Pseudonocardia asaccharolytica DSM 44247 = NBRC 16224 TaxID=1123024 RepID=A0A511D7R6_9PSEU|nr:proteasome subunit beta [Pseudonocardia asaccharolytica]GEL19674.1 proteasome subunit beta [Pseudonocardia asaccharolytica DSM 44247 = NBRC 16224]
MDPRPVNAATAGHGGNAAAFFAPGSPSFTDFVAATAPHLLPGRFAEGMAVGSSQAGALNVPHGTTIVALVCSEGVVIAGDRRATMGNVIAQRDVEKVFITDAYSAVGFAGTAGIGTELVRLFAVDLEHYEKIEGVPLSLDGKANKLAGMVRQNLGAALQGFVALPLFVGYDPEEPDPAKAGRIVSFDVTGSRADEQLAGYHAIGSGSVFAKSALKKRHDVAADLATTLRNAVEALYDAADDDTATGGPDATRRIFPVVVSITGAEGAVRRSEEEIAEIAAEVLAVRAEKPGG